MVLLLEFAERRSGVLQMIRARVDLAVGSLANLLIGSVCWRRCVSCWSADVAV
jgi:hypothetical protein